MFSTSSLSWAEGKGWVGLTELISYPSPVPPKASLKASLSNKEAGRELGLEPPPVVAAPGVKKGPGPVPVDGFVRGIVSSAVEDGREGLGVRTLK